MSTARIHWASGPVVRARPEGAFQLREAVQVGARALLGEVTRIDRDEIVIQVYEDTTGLRPGDTVRGAGTPLAVRLGPALLGNVFDGLLRPLAAGAAAQLESGVRRRTPVEIEFAPGVKPGDVLEPGTPFGTARNGSGVAQACLLPPGTGGEIVSVAPAGRLSDEAPVCSVRGADGAVVEIAMSHDWPVRVPRPAAARLPSDEPLLTGQRILDSLFPVGLGGKAAIPGGFGTGKTVLLETLAKWCHADVIVYLGCGERGNEMAGLVEEFPQLADPRTNRPLMERTVIIANTSNMPVAAREASIYSAITVAEYFRDQGKHVALMADSTSRWAEALREVSGRLGELPGEGGFPPYLSSRLAEFYERAARVRTLAGDTGSVTILSAISPPAGDFSEPVTSHTKRYVRSYWALDTKRAQARFYPAIHPLQSYSENAPDFARWWEASGNARWLELRRRFLTLLDEQAKIERMARIIGKDALPPGQRLTLTCAELVNDAFLRQSAFSEVDRYAGPARQAAMMQVLARFVALAEAAGHAGVEPEAIERMEGFRRLQRMGEEIGEDGIERFAQLTAALEREFAGLAKPEEARHAP
ncbi:MAG: V-type ATP synthase subunit A [Candidatus Rokubacteria bacterium]|nr:V-type ATP synthase subunit A [Candidatus Rokubacteria bacterium]